MSSLSFILRSSTKAGRHPGSLFLRVIHDRKVKTMSLSCYLYAEEWDVARQEIIYPGNTERIQYLERVEEKISTCVTSMNRYLSILKKQGRYTAKDIIMQSRLSKDNGKLLGWVETLARELTQARQERLARAYRTVAKGLVKFNKGIDIPLTHINSCLVKAFEKDLMEKGKMPNTISYYMRNLRSIYNKAVMAKRISPRQDNPFTGVYTKVKTTSKRALTVQETTRLYEIVFHMLRAKSSDYLSENEYVDNLQYAWRLYMFCFFAQGMCFIDMAHLRKDNIRNGVCTYYRKKTRQQIEVTINEGMQKIIDSFAQDVKYSPYLFPILKDDGINKQTQYDTALRTQNRRLKALAKLAGINRLMTTHVARHRNYYYQLKTSGLEKYFS
ncbi:phage integrase SAM-like domain-containing protein [Dysgonomonas mossii]|uniref:phage integrase SAM-like domain-containing protein n=1 Tax=Dysgonomonas mossii TaxID=163665 RepID=UPI0039952588